MAVGAADGPGEARLESGATTMNLGVMVEVIVLARKIEFEPKIHWQDVPTEAPDLAAAKVIGQEFIINDTGLSPNEVSVQVFNSIKKWLTANSVALDVVQEKRAHQGAIDANIKTDGNSLMARIISTLSQEQLQRIQLPLDVVSRLLKSF